MNPEILKLEKKAALIRKKVIELAYHSKSGHLGSALSLVEILTALYFSFLTSKDRFILSKGHGAMALYVTLSLKGFFPQSWLKTYLSDGSFLGAHPSPQIPGIEFATGSLGHGLSVAVGMALAAKYNGENHRIITILSDGECNEGSVWEAALSATQFQLDNLLVIIDYNKIQALGRTQEVMGLEPLAKKWKSFGFCVQETEGHQIQKIMKTLKKIPIQKNKPHLIIAHTIKGYGLSFLQNTVQSHYHVLNKKEYQHILKALPNA